MKKLSVILLGLIVTSIVLSSCSSTQQCPQTYGYDNYKPQRTSAGGI